VAGYSGFITLPSEDNTYNASIFFWYFGKSPECACPHIISTDLELESRTDAANAPTTIFMPGGPGSSFLDNANGLPCTVNADGQSTSLNPWSWNNEVNMLYLDTPVQTGFSYTNAESGMFDFLTRVFTPTNDEDVTTNITTVKATLSSQNPANTLNTTQQVARQMWQICQLWFQEYDRV
jgi:carboxypeptidase C (cathepsin A)